MKLSRSSLLSVLSIGLSIMEHPNFQAAVDVLKHAKTEIDKAEPELEIGSAFVTALAPGAGSIVTQILSDTGLISQLADSVSQVLQTKTPSATGGGQQQS